MTYPVLMRYKVVLANGSLVNANARSNSDLWWALKGGGNNFGRKPPFATVKAMSNGTIRYRNIVHPVNTSRPRSLGRCQDLFTQSNTGCPPRDVGIPIEPQQRPICKYLHPGFHHQLHHWRRINTRLPQTHSRTASLQAILLHPDHQRHHKTPNPNPAHGRPKRPAHTPVRKRNPTPPPTPPDQNPDPTN